MINCTLILSKKDFLLLFVYIICYRIIQCRDHNSIMEVFKNNFSDYQGSFGVILFLYSVVLTKVSFRSVCVVSMFRIMSEGPGGTSCTHTFFCECPIGY